MFTDCDITLTRHADKVRFQSLLSGACRPCTANVEARRTKSRSDVRNSGCEEVFFVCSTSPAKQLWLLRADTLNILESVKTSRS